MRPVPAFRAWPALVSGHDTSPVTDACPVVHACTVHAPGHHCGALRRACAIDGRTVCLQRTAHCRGAAGINGRLGEHAVARGANHCAAGRAAHDRAGRVDVLSRADGAAAAAYALAGVSGHVCAGGRRKSVRHCHQCRGLHAGNSRGTSRPERVSRDVQCGRHDWGGCGGTHVPLAGGRANAAAGGGRGGCGWAVGSGTWHVAHASARRGG